MVAHASNDYQRFKICFILWEYQGYLIPYWMCFLCDILYFFHFFSSSYTSRSLTFECKLLLKSFIYFCHGLSGTKLVLQFSLYHHSIQSVGTKSKFSRHDLHLTNFPLQFSLCWGIWPAQFHLDSTIQPISITFPISIHLFSDQLEAILSSPFGKFSVF